MKTVISTIHPIVTKPGEKYGLTRLFFRERKDSGPTDVPDTDTSDKTSTDSEKAILCSRCRTVITSARHTVSVNDRHLHTFFNPAGIVYEIGCFKLAKGCVIYGQPTDDFSWFTGYNWQYAICTTCLVHLGWFFSSPDNTFYGLIKDKLVEE